MSKVVMSQAKFYLCLFYLQYKLQNLIEINNLISIKYTNICINCIKWMNKLRHYYKTSIMLHCRRYKRTTLSFMFNDIPLFLTSIYVKINLFFSFKVQHLY